jgi:phospholipid/cholesterol/gamma-HCH transport system substrate-binding protein
MLKQLNATLQGSQPDLNRTLKEAGPTVQALGAVLNGLGADGLSIKTLLSNMHKVTEVLAARKASISSSILDLNRMTSASAVHQRALSDGLRELPSTLDVAKATLDKLPAATDATVPLLDDLRPGADRLPSVSRNLKLVMRDLRPALHDLPPVLKDADRVLGRGPRFFDAASDTLGQLAETVKPAYAGNAVRFLRPYTPEITGWAGNWGSIFSSYDSFGRFVNILVSGGESSLEGWPDVAVPGRWPEGHLPPGINGDQPWLDANAWDTDANGSRPR